MKNYLLLLALFAFGAVQAQNIPDSETLKGRIKEAFENVQKTQSYFLEEEVSKELQEQYYEGVISLKPEDFFNKQLAKEEIERYSNIKGIEEVVKDFLNSVENSDNPSPINHLLYMRVYVVSKDPNVDRLMRSNVPNKYATLMINITPVSDTASVFLNGKFICTVKQAEKGLRLHSNKDYRFEVKVGNRVYCRSTIKLEGKEIREINCSIR